MALSNEKSAYIPRDWVEPVHHYQIEMYEVLVSLYSHIKENYQTKIDAAFDRASKEIGFVVATSLPVTVEVGSNKTVKDLFFSAENLKGTIFERQVLNEALALKKDKIPDVRAGTYEIKLLWLEALKIKIKTDWMEPVHFRVFDRFFSMKRKELDPYVHEPVHYYPGLELDMEAQILAQVLNQVYPELKIADRIRMDKEILARDSYYGREASLSSARAKFTPWQEPVHLPGRFTRYQDRLRFLRYYRDWVEPVHFRENLAERFAPGGLDENVLGELSSLLKRYGY